MNLREEFADVAARHADAEMAWWNGASMTYADAARHADALRPRLGGASVALVAGKSLGTYATIWAAVRDGACFVPLNPDWNVSRLVNVIGQVEPGLVACEAAWADEHADALAALGYREGAPAPAPAGEAPLRVFERQGEGARPLADYAARAGVEDLIYVIFTSGSTGVPKGVPIHRAGIDHYIRVTRETFGVEESERWMQSVQLTFDPAIHDMFLAWSTGGTVIGIPPEHSPLGPRYVRRLEPHNWMCVPSAAGRSLSLGLLKEGSMPSLRRSFFVGESLPPDIAAAWLRATPNGELINIYGPTETTMTCTWHRFDPVRDTGPVVPIGRPLAGCDVTLVDGEIVHAGPQVFGGYLSNPEENAARLSILPDGTRRFRTGDRAQVDERGTMHFRGRMDWQIKVRGHRVEVDEVEGALRAETGRGLAAVVPVHEEMPGAYKDLHAFVERGSSGGDLKARLAERLPPYMVPRHVTELADFPRNTNGKVDRIALRRMAEEANPVAPMREARPAAPGAR